MDESPAPESTKRVDPWRYAFRPVSDPRTYRLVDGVLMKQLTKEEYEDAMVAAPILSRIPGTSGNFQQVQAMSPTRVAFLEADEG